MTVRIGVLGGTGPQGKGLAYRFAVSGFDVTIGSRDAGRAEQTAHEIRVRVNSGVVVTGTDNVTAAEANDVVLVAVPWNGHGAFIRSVADALAGKVVISCVNPLGFDARGPYGLEVAESAAEETQRLLPSACVVGAFHHVAAASLWRSDSPMSHEDVLVCGDDAEARALVAELARTVTGKAGVEVGALRLARQLEPLTAMLISINKRYKTRSGVAITGVRHPPRPPGPRQGCPPSTVMTDPVV